LVEKLKQNESKRERIQKVLRPKFKNDRRSTKEEVTEVYRDSVCGGIFSAGEGACFSSSEYLLFGLPVVLTKSRGGRHIALAEEMKKRFVAEIDLLFQVYDIDHDEDTYFQKHYHTLSRGLRHNTFIFIFFKFLLKNAKKYNYLS